MTLTFLPIILAAIVVAERNILNTTASILQSNQRFYWLS